MWKGVKRNTKRCKRREILVLIILEAFGEMN